MAQHVYDNGVSRESQHAYNKRYRENQRKKRLWLDQFADTIGVPRKEVADLNIEDLATAYRIYMKHS